MYVRACIILKNYLFSKFFILINFILTYHRFSYMCISSVGALFLYIYKTQKYLKKNKKYFYVLLID